LECFLGWLEGTPSALRSFDDDGGQERQRKVHKSNYVSISGVDCGGALCYLDSNLAECFGQGSEKLQADTESNMKDLYEEALRDLSDGGRDTFFHSERHNRSPNIPHNEVCVYFIWLFNFGPFVFF
jgi:hypothetical protein